MEDLAVKRCIPCSKEMIPLSDKQENDLFNNLTGWMINRKKIHTIHKIYKCTDFMEAMVFVNRVAELSEDEGHHPDIYISYQYVTIALWTKKIFGLSENDFILAAKIDLLFDALKHDQVIS
ncbi:MAG: 4a-hydroxytetrahydrobiopterin dehydratase [Spirochaetales bacterium]|nr:4a-hydroxytetrahydrobiopterin dehydratase [Spirochaetales bacterium]